MATTRKTVASTGELADGEMKQVEVGDQPILLTNVDGSFHAVDAHCTHYGGRLVDGELERSTGTVICPLHHAVFDVTTGEDVEPPARDCLDRYPVEVDGDEVIVELPEEPDRAYEYGSETDEDERRFVVLGAGAAASMAAETLRREGFEGNLVLVTLESELPYDRPNLSKDYLAGIAEPEWIPLRDADFYDDHDIDIRKGERAVDLDPEAHSVELESGEELSYEKLLVATGANPVELDAPGTELDGVEYLRTLGDANRILDQIDGAERAVVIGSGFIGMEAAFSLREQGLDVTVASVDSEPLEGALGPTIGRAVRRAHESNGVDFELETAVERLAEEGDLEEIALENGTQLGADLAVIGIGVRPATEFADALERTPDGGITVDRSLEGAEDVYAAGDIARFPDPRTFREIRVEHWRVAEQHGRVAARNMLGESSAYDEIPFFWTRHFDTTYKYVGFANDWEDVIVDGDLANNDFVAYYVDDDEILSAVGTRTDDLTRIHALMRHDQMPSTSELLAGFEPE